MAEKAKVIALNTIVITTSEGQRGDRAKGDPGVRPQTMTIPPGTTFMADTVKHRGQAKSQYDELMAAKAIRDWSEEDEAALNRLSNVVGGGEFTENFRVSETVSNANDGQSIQQDGSGTGTNDPAAVRKSTAPAPKRKTEGELAAEIAKKEEPAKVAAADEAAAERKAQDAKQAEASAQGRQTTSSTSGASTSANASTTTGKSKIKDSAEKDDDVV